MKVVIFAGGAGTRLSEETDVRPKPMVEVGGKPMLWHIMKIYSHYGFNEFIICLGYKGYVIKEYFHHYDLHMSDVTIDLRANTLKKHKSEAEPWKVTLVDTGTDTMTGGRLDRVRQYIGKKRFMLTYGDGVADVDIPELVRSHVRARKTVTITTVRSPGRFGVLEFDKKGAVTRFQEKPVGGSLWVNGGFFVCEPEVFSYLDGGDACMWEFGPLSSLAEEGKVAAYKHAGFWKPMDTLRDRRELESLWATGNAPWKVWK
jgi:glucose-1-phosphate cytidylyltransferase